MELVTPWRTIGIEVPPKSKSSAGRCMTAAIAARVPPEDNGTRGSSH
jgi:hypothetical protein